MLDESTGPDFFCIGMPKAGTQWLYESLHQCPGFWMPPIKEMHFFDKDFLESDRRVRADTANLRRCHEVLSGPMAGQSPVGALRADMPNRMRDHDFAERWIRMSDNGYRLEDYHALFRSKGSGLSGDITPTYSALSEREVQIVKSAFPRLKVILLIRDPVGRAWSSFNMYIRYQLMSKAERRMGNVIRIMEEKATLEELTHFMNLHGSRQRSFPSVSYGRWVSVFGERQVHVTFFQDIVSRPAGVIEDVCTFLGVAPESPPVPARNAKEKRPRTAMGDEHKAFLNDYFRDEYRAMRALFPGKASEWVG
ncbi:MAG: sulfotransferase [Actinomycetota bacterium]|nr:sulfotransferase [Actinomycetota bacterium]